MFSPCSFCQSNVCAAILNSRISQQTVITHDAWCCGKAWSNSCLKHILQSCVPHSDLHCDLARISDRYNLVLCQWRRSRQPTGDRKSASITAAEIQGVQGSLRISWHTHARARAREHAHTNTQMQIYGRQHARARAHTHAHAHGLIRMQARAHLRADKFDFENGLVVTKTFSEMTFLHIQIRFWILWIPVSIGK